MQTEQFTLVDCAIGGDKQALEELLVSVQDMVYNLSLRMLGSPHDAEDAAQEIYIRIIISLSSFKKESAFSTWVYRIATNHLLNYKKSFFAKQPPLSFEFYGADIEAGFLESSVDMTGSVDEEILAQELKMSCTNVMLQCFDPESRLIYVLGIMFKVDSKVCGEILGITPEAYRQRLSRIRQKMAGFLKQYCGLASSEKCNCQKRIGYAINSHRLNPVNLEYTRLEQADNAVILEYTQAMEEMDTQSLIFAELPKYRSPQSEKTFCARYCNPKIWKRYRHRLEGGIFMSRALRHKELVNTRLANNYGGWMYCEGCNKTIGYLCYATYDRFTFNFKCKCGSSGSAYLAFENGSDAQSSNRPLITVKNRLCCPTDESPLVTILAKNLDAYKYEIVCKSCNTKYQEEQ